MPGLESFRQVSPTRVSVGDVRELAEEGTMHCTMNRLSRSEIWLRGPAAQKSFRACFFLRPDRGRERERERDAHVEGALLVVATTTSTTGGSGSAPCSTIQQQPRRRASDRSSGRGSMRGQGTELPAVGDPWRELRGGLRPTLVHRQTSAAGEPGAHARRRTQRESHQRPQTQPQSREEDAPIAE